MAEREGRRPYQPRAAVTTYHTEAGFSASPPAAPAPAAPIAEPAPAPEPAPKSRRDRGPSQE